MENRLYIDLHVLQTVPPSCINRDDTGSPKTAIFGGTVRARVSSQAWKKAVRDMFKETGTDTGIRTKRVEDIITEAIIELNSNIEVSEAKKLANKILHTTKVQSDKKDPEKTDALFFISKAQAKALAQLATTGQFDKTLADKAITDHPAIDIAMFGRMVAKDADLNIDASVQVAHAISTHKVNNEFDYFTAIDENKTKEDIESTGAGAGMLGTVEYNSSTLYRYANINVHDLADSLKENPHEAVKRFVDAFIRSMPTGKQNTFANTTPPFAAYITVRTDTPLNFAGAFEKAVSPSDNGFEEASSNKLKAYADNVYDTFADVPKYEFAVGNFGRGENLNLKALLEKLDDIVNNEI
jgi:CRISPR system Cascade subunit CasC